MDVAVLGLADPAAVGALEGPQPVGVVAATGLEGGPRLAARDLQAATPSAPRSSTTSPTASSTRRSGRGAPGHEELGRSDDTRTRRSIAAGQAKPRSAARWSPTR